MRARVKRVQFWINSNRIKDLRVWLRIKQGGIMDRASRIKDHLGIGLKMHGTKVADHR